MPKMKITHSPKKTRKCHQHVLHFFCLKHLLVRKNGKSLVQGQLSTMGKAMKAMKSPKLNGIVKNRNGWEN